MIGFVTDSRLQITTERDLMTRIYDLTMGCDSDVGDDLKEGAERESISGVINAVGDIGVGKGWVCLVMWCPERVKGTHRAYHIHDSHLHINR